LELARRVRETRPDLVVLAGWMLVLSEGFLDVLKRDWDEESLSLPPSDDAEGKDSKVTPSLQTLGSSPYVKGALKEGTPIPIINLHPALPGTFPGAHAIQDAWNAFNAPLPPSEPEPTSALDAAINAALEGLSLASDSPSTPSTSAPARITKTGIMIHRVIPLLDAGEPVLVKEIEMVEGESVEGLEERIHVVEHLALVEAVGKVVEMLADGSWWD
jgi:phosphoribosylglycinamide formyltransferase